MYRKMLVLLDGSELAETVFPYAKDLAGRLDVNLVLLNVCTPEESEFVPMHRAYVNQAAEIVRRQAHEIQKKTLPKGGKPVEVRGELAAGYPADEILHYADENEIDLILLATHGHSGLKRWSIGSVAGKILSAAKAPVWLIPTGIPEETPYDKWPSKTIIAPLDGSELAESVLPHVEALAKQRSTKPVEVVLLRVWEPPTITPYYTPDIAGAPLNWGEYTKEEAIRGKQAARGYLAGVEERLKKSGVTARSEVLEGKAGDEIISYASKNPFSMIVMATHGRSGLSRLVYGSVAANLIHGASRPIFLVRAK